MTNAPNPPSEILINRVADWLMKMALEDADLETICRGCCDRLVAAGMPLARANFSFSVLHPLYRAMGFTWIRGEGLQVQGYRHMRDGEEDRFIQSPFYHMMTNDLDLLRRRLDNGTPSEFPIFDELKAIGVTDYMAFMSQFGQGKDRGMLGSWSTDQRGGFSDPDIEALLRIQKRLAVTTKMAVQGELAGNMLSTYLGQDAGGRVLNGQIRRGDGETIRAAIVMADMRGSTSMAETLGRQGYIDALNIFFDAVAGAFADSGAEILSFVGDGFLAIFPCGRNQAESTQAASRTLSAAQEALRRMTQANERREEAGEAPIGFGLGLHVGNVMFGNVGLEDRLTFSVFGTSVNEAARLEALTKTYKTPIIASDDFVSYCETTWQKLGEEKLKGITEPIGVFTPDCDKNVIKFVEVKKRAQAGLTDAEHVILLHRDGTR